MGFDAAYTPENEVEKELMEDLHIATRRAYRRGLSKPEIARLTAFMASATLASDDDLERREEAHSAENNGEGEEDDAGSEELPEPEVCPECEEPILRVVAGMGGDHTVQPCGCQFDYEERDRLGDWAYE